MTPEQKDRADALAKRLCIAAGLDPDEIIYGHNSIVGVEEDGWPAWEYFWEEAAERILKDDGQSTL